MRLHSMQEGTHEQGEQVDDSVHSQWGSLCRSKGPEPCRGFPPSFFVQVGLALSVHLSSENAYYIVGAGEFMDATRRGRKRGPEWRT
jgi:hypothetical protein